MLVFVSSFFINACQKSPVNLGSLSEIVTNGIPNLQNMCSANNWAVSSAVAVVFVFIKTTLSVKISVTVRIASKPALVTGKLVTKSVDIVCHLDVGGTIGCGGTTDG